jgi:hypothetical protein
MCFLDSDNALASPRYHISSKYASKFIAKRRFLPTFNAHCKKRASIKALMVGISGTGMTRAALKISSFTAPQKKGGKWKQL